MGEQEPSGPLRLPESSFDDRLDSWKEIAAHLKRGVTTVQRWEHLEGLPVHRHLHNKRGSVYAFKSEIDAWWQKGGHRLEAGADPGGQPDAAAGVSPAVSAEGRFFWTRSSSLKLAILTAVGLGAIALWIASEPIRLWLREGGLSTKQLALIDELQNGPGSAVAVSPDRRFVVYVGWRDGMDQLFRRSTDDLHSVPIRHTERARAPFFSPDGRQIGFFADGQLKKVPLEGGPAWTICTVTGTPAGATWASDDTIIFARLGSSLQQVPAGGGIPKGIMNTSEGPADVDRRWPEVLPGGRAVVFTEWSGSLETARLAVQSVENGERRILGLGSNPRVAGTDHLVFARADGLWLVAFDAARLSLVGSPARVVESVRPRHAGAADYHLAGDGSLVYVPTRPASTNELVLVDLERGSTTSVAQDQQLYSSPRISPEGTRVAVVVRSSEGAFQIWVYDLADGSRKRLPAEADSFDPVWTPDGTRITYASTRRGPSNLFWIRADGTTPPELLLKSELGIYPSSWSPNGLLAFLEMNTSGGLDVWVLSRDLLRSPVLATSSNESKPRFSPDGRWLAYTSSESDGDQVYVGPYPGTGKRWLISPGGGREPIWSADGRVIYYRSRLGDQVFKVAVSLAPVFSAGRPSLLFQGAYEKRPLAGAAANYDVAPDGRRFVMIKRAGEPAPQQIVLVLNWLDGLKRRASATP